MDFANKGGQKVEPLPVSWLACRSVHLPCAGWTQNRSLMRGAPPGKQRGDVPFQRKYFWNWRIWLPSLLLLGSAVWP